MVGLIIFNIRVADMRKNTYMEHMWTFYESKTIIHACVLNVWVHVHQHTCMFCICALKKIFYVHMLHMCMRYLLCKFATLLLASQQLAEHILAACQIAQSKDTNPIARHLELGPTPKLQQVQAMRLIKKIKENCQLANQM